MNSKPKIRPEHLMRLACVYVRQSTLHQVRDHPTSTEVQYGLVERAVQLGWPREKVRVYDGDLGLSSRVESRREDFRQLVADVGLAKMGIVLAFDVTRIARNNADWHRLLDLCAVCDTLIADSDGVYELAAYNDRLLLGMKGTMSEAESHLIKTRLIAGIKRRAGTGELRKRLPVGLEYDDQGRVQGRHALVLKVEVVHLFHLPRAKHRQQRAHPARYPIRRAGRMNGKMKHLSSGHICLIRLNQLLNALKHLTGLF